MLPSLLSGELPAVLQFLALSERQLRFFGHVARAYPTGSPSGHWGVAATGQSLEETLWMPSYQLAEGDWYRCTVSQHHLHSQSVDWYWQTKQYRKIQINKLNTNQKSRQPKIQQNKTAVVQLPLTTLGQETRWAYSTTPPSPHNGASIMGHVARGERKKVQTKPRNCENEHGTRNRLETVRKLGLFADSLWLTK